MKDKRNIALFAHVDAGKTSITEQFLFLAEKIRSLGSVDKGSTQTDSMEVEKQRGITVNSTILTFDWKGTQINLIDTPGHVDFSSETEKALLAIDSAVVIISAAEGVQAQTEKVVASLRRYGKPFLIFINKVDRDGVDMDVVLEEIRHELGLTVAVLDEIKAVAGEQPAITTIWTPATYADQTDLLETIVEQDDTLFEAYLNGKMPAFNPIDSILVKATKTQELTPVFFGSAKYGTGIRNLLDGIIRYLPAPVPLTEELSGVVFKTKHIKGEGKWAAVRLFSGEIKARMTVRNATQAIDEKIGLLKNTDLQQPAIIQSISQGEIAWVQGFVRAKPGDYIGIPPDNQVDAAKTPPLLSVQVIPEMEKDINSLVEAMHVLHNENPDLNFSFIKEERELSITIHGDIQREILQTVLSTRFGIAVQFSAPTVIYKETPTRTAEGYVRYWMPKPCWAIMRFKIEPGTRGSGVAYSSIVSVDDIKSRYQNDVEKTIPVALEQGILGWEVTDLKITLIEGEDHVQHTKSNDFAIATPMGIMDGLSKAAMTLLEPVLTYKIISPTDFLGSISGELTKLRATIDSPEFHDEKVKLTGTIPVATSLDFPVKLNSITGGKAKLTTQFHAYQACDVSLGKTREFKGISPLDTAKYILKARKALS